MNAPGTDVVLDLFAAVCAYINDDPAGMAAVGTAVLDAGTGLDLLAAAVIAAGEYLQDVARERQMDPCRLVQVLRDAHRQNTGPDGPEAVVLDGIVAYLSGEGFVWLTHGQCPALMASSEGVLACVRVVAASLSWRAADLNVTAAELISSTCLGASARHWQMVG